MPDTVVSMNRHCMQSVNAEKIDLQQLTALELLQRCMGSREELAWLVFFSKIRPFLAAIVINAIRHCRLPDSCLAEDMVQNALLKLCANDFKVLRELECFHEGSLFGFLKAVAFNVVQDYFRSAYCQKRGSGRAEENIENIGPTCDQSRDFDRVFEQKVLIRQIEDCLQSRNLEAQFARDYQIFWLYYSQGLTAKEIAQLPNIDLGIKGVESTLLRLTKFVRLKLNTSHFSHSAGPNPIQNRRAG